MQIPFSFKPVKPDRAMSQVFASGIALMTAVSGALQPTPPVWAETTPVQALVQPSVQPTEPSVTSTEKYWNFSMKNYRMRHHHAFQMLNITVNCSYESSDTAKVSSRLLMIYAEINQFLQDYPNEEDYWEIINRELTQTVLRRYPELSSVVITLEVLPSDRLPYTRASIVSRQQNGYVDEGWRFSTRVPVHWQGSPVSYEVEYLYRDDITNEEYPDFVPIHHRITQLLAIAAAEGAAWEHVNQDIAKTVLQKYPVLDSLTSRVDARLEKVVEQDVIIFTQR